MLGARLRLRPWLEQQINSGHCPGVQWVDQSAGVFQIPWKHAARHGWSLERDASLFRNWAIHTGRYRPGVDKPDPKTWKANFRCALNSLSDVRELQEKSRKRGHDAFRVYTLLPHNRGSTVCTAVRISRGESKAMSAPPQRGVVVKKFAEAFWRIPEPGGVEEQRNGEERSSGHCSQALHQNRTDEQEQTEAVLKVSRWRALGFYYTRAALEIYSRSDLAGKQSGLQKPITNAS